MGSLLLISLFIGMRHALEADHVAAVASQVYQKHSLAQAIKLGGAWGLGHTIILFLTGSIVILLDTRLSEQLAMGLEVAVGIMLILLGANMLRSVIGERMRFQEHRHIDGHYSFHIHSHADRPLFTQDNSSHDHHLCGFPGRVEGWRGNPLGAPLSVSRVSSFVPG
ncbi:MAG: hypothetical protein GY703_02620 [Gammaproteobacteria bacterium]|nr:hypothetical protein [Gammaproteobacteria bacterium]